MKTTQKTNKILIIAVLALLVAIIILAAVQMFTGRNDFYAVYLKTGDLYFGKMVRFPYFGLKNVYTLQATQDAQNPLRIQKFSEVFWGPSDYLKLNHDEVVWMTKLDPQGQLNKVLVTNPNLVPPQGQQVQQQQPPVQEETPVKETPKKEVPPVQE